MLHGKLIQLRPVTEGDLDTVYRRHVDISNRGDYFPINIRSEAWFRKQFQDNGFWSDDDGLLLVINDARTIVGHIEFF